jgi:hypothetical protein
MRVLSAGGMRGFPVVGFGDEFDFVGAEVAGVRSYPLVAQLFQHVSPASFDRLRMRGRGLVRAHERPWQPAEEKAC